jgi:hypothetical protein
VDGGQHLVGQCAEAVHGGAQLAGAGGSGLPSAAQDPVPAPRCCLEVISRGYQTALQIHGSHNTRACQPWGMGLSCSTVTLQTLCTWRSEATAFICSGGRNKGASMLECAAAALSHCCGSHRPHRALTVRVRGMVAVDFGVVQGHLAEEVWSSGRWAGRACGVLRPESYYSAGRISDCW